MVTLQSLWLPILLSSVFVFIASSIIWMVLPIHKKDFKTLGDKEDGVLSAVRGWGLRPGIYMYPCCDPSKMKDPVVLEKFKRGPWGNLLVMGGPPNMGVALTMWIVNLLIVSTLVAYVASHTITPGAKYLEVFRIAATVSVLAYAGNALTDSIWKGRPWSHLPGAIFDGAVYAGLTAGTFSWLWPKAVGA